MRAPLHGPPEARLSGVRPLRFTAPDPERDLPGHVRAGSAIRRWGERLVVVQDDVNALALLDEGAATLTPLALPAARDGRRTFGDTLGNKALKMDLEACVHLPDGRLVALGSGSTGERERLVVLYPALGPRVVDAHALYAALRAQHEFSGSELNVEGAVCVAGSLRLFQRGNGAVADGRDPVNATCDIDLAAFTAWLDGKGGLPGLGRVRRFDLGSASGVPFGFTDATVSPDGRVVFLACAEDSPDTFNDGAVLGCRIGVLHDDHVQTADILGEDGTPTRLKLEGIDWQKERDDGSLEFVVVADMDEPHSPALMGTLLWSARRA